MAAARTSSFLAVAAAVLASVAAGLSASPPQYTRVKLNKLMRSLDKESFEQIYEWESFLEQEAGATTLAKTLRRLEHKAKSFGVELKPDFCANAKATEKRRAQQKDYEGNKEEARLAELGEIPETLAGLADSDDIDALEAAIATAVRVGLEESNESFVAAKAALEKALAAKAEAERLAAEEAALAEAAAKAEQEAAEQAEAEKQRALEEAAAAAEADGDGATEADDVADDGAPADEEEQP